MWLSDISIKRPVLATVINLLLVVFGVFGLANISVREYPDIDPPVVSVRTSYPGASAQIVESQITQVIEDRISGIEGIRSISSSSRDGSSQITIEFSLARDIDAAANDVRDRVSRVIDDLPDQADPPEVVKADADASPILWMVLTSDRLDGMALTDYAERYLVDRFTSVPGVAEIRLGGAQRYAMRIWLDRARLAARGLTAEDVENALVQQNIERPAGRIESEQREFTLRTARPFRTPEDFAELVISRGADGFPVRLGDIARIELGPQDPRGSFKANGVSSLGLGVIKTSKANTLEVAEGIRAVMRQLQPTLPAGMKLEMNYDSSAFIAASLDEVMMTLIIAAASVIVVLLLFLGSVRATLVPAVTVPISLIASFLFLYLFDFSINILTLLALVLAIGLVVDDAIVVVENIHRRLELGEPPLLAAFRGTREVGFAVIATTVVLCAVFVPIGFLQGNIGRLFREFALALASAVACSSIVALSLSSVLSAALLRKNDHRSRVLDALERGFERLSNAYQASLRRILPHRTISVLVLAALVVGVIFLLRLIPEEFTPPEDRGGFFIGVRAPEGASFAYTESYVDQIEARIMAQLGQGEIERIIARIPDFGGGEEINTARFIVTLTPWDERTRSSQQIAEDYVAKLGDLTGVRISIFQRAGFGVGGSSVPVQIAIGGSHYAELAEWRDRVLQRARAIPGLLRLDSDYQENKPQIELEVDLARAADLGVPVASIARALETFMGDRRVTRFERNGEEYDIILQSPDDARRSPADLSDIYVRAASDGSLVPLSSLVKMRESAAAAAYNRLDRMRAITISAALAPGYTLGQALDDLESIIREELPDTVQIGYRGDSREFRDAGSAVVFTFAMALLIVYLALGAQFESFIHPIVIMTTVPLAIFGALAALWSLDMTLNIYSQIGIVMLIGLAAKNGILIVEFANQLRDAGHAFDDALIEASRIRLRPILMTSFATIAGAVPLILASGAGAEARQILGVVIFFGVAFSTVLTLYIVPVFYGLLCRRTGSPGRHAARLHSQIRQSSEEIV
ncbi:multidrug efflux pump [Fontimonas thermophila]|uniref:Multidrug efflux pump n=1 Tax=Fontimonas thermophila TaxID=1076937 RepID=A0A1I2HUX1_9GAMM|nr:efflux RND transporter permease subunit [Fontimonas thermophila]SFF33398.1 multidrug efflux pump [Fontimonas thermophila]